MEKHPIHRVSDLIVALGACPDKIVTIFIPENTDRVSSGKRYSIARVNAERTAATYIVDIDAGSIIHSTQLPTGHPVTFPPLKPQSEYDDLYCQGFVSERKAEASRREWVNSLPSEDRHSLFAWDDMIAKFTVKSLIRVLKKVPNQEAQVHIWLRADGGNFRPNSRYCLRCVNITRVNENIVDLDAVAGDMYANPQCQKKGGWY